MNKTLLLQLINYVFMFGTITGASYLQAQNLQPRQAIEWSPSGMELEHILKFRGQQKGFEVRVQSIYELSGGQFLVQGEDLHNSNLLGIYLLQATEQFGTTQIEAIWHAKMTYSEFPDARGLHFVGSSQLEGESILWWDVVAEDATGLLAIVPDQDQYQYFPVAQYDAEAAMWIGSGDQIVYGDGPLGKTLHFNRGIYRIEGENGVQIFGADEFYYLQEQEAWAIQTKAIPLMEDKRCLRSNIAYRVPAEGHIILVDPPHDRSAKFFQSVAAEIAESEAMDQFQLYLSRAAFEAKYCSGAI